MTVSPPNRTAHPRARARARAGAGPLCPSGATVPHLPDGVTVGDSGPATFRVDPADLVDDPDPTRECWHCDDGVPRPGHLLAMRAGPSGARARCWPWWWCWWWWPWLWTWGYPPPYRVGGGGAQCPTGGARRGCRRGVPTGGGTGGGAPGVQRGPALGVVGPGPELGPSRARAQCAAPPPLASQAKPSRAAIERASKPADTAPTRAKI